MSILKIKDANNNFVDVPSIKGRGISSIQKTSTSGLVDTYTITYSDGTTSTFNVTNGAGGGNENLDGLNYYECTAFGAFKVMFLYSGDYDYDTSIDGYSFALKLLELIYGLSTLKSQSGIDELINDDNGYLAPTLKRMFSTLLNALTEDSSCMCSLYSTTVYFAPNDNYINVLFGDGTSIVYSVSEGVQTITFNRSNTYHAGTNISIANDGTINNTYTLPSDVVQDSNYVHTDNNYTSAEKTKLANLEEENEALYNDHPDITATGTNVTLNGTGDFKMKVSIGGNSTQETTSTSEGGEYDSPSPEHKQDINNVEGDVVVISKNSNNTKSNTVTFPLSQGQKLMLGDTLKDDGVYHKRAKVTANELKTVTTYVNQLTDFVRISFMISDLTNKLASAIPSGFCNYLKFLYDYTNESNHFYARGNVIYVFLEKTLLSSLNVTGVRAFLDEHPDLEIEYDLAEETPEDYTTTQQTAYNKLKEMQSYYDLTYVTGTSDNAQPILTAQAKKSLKVMQNEINNIESRLSLLE